MDLLLMPELAPYSPTFLRRLPVEKLDMLLRGAAAKADAQTAAKQDVDPAIETLLSVGHRVYAQRISKQRTGQVLA